MASKLPSCLSVKEDDIKLLLAAQSHIGTKNCDKQMEPYVWKRRADGVLDIVTKRETVVSHVFSISQAFTFLTLARLGRNLSSLLVSSLLSKILMISVSFRLVLTVTVPS